MALAGVSVAPAGFREGVRRVLALARAAAAAALPGPLAGVAWAAGAAVAGVKPGTDARGCTGVCDAVRIGSRPPEDGSNMLPPCALRCVVSICSII
eukprot:scaffold3551_cov408-Prasinococcus_capsulatus_cf.AAC.7